MISFGTFVVRAVEIYKLAILARVLLSWFQASPQGHFSSFIHAITEPYMGFFRRIIPPLGMVDLSPLAAYFALDLLVYGLRSAGLI